MAKREVAVKLVKLRARVSFMDIRQGDESLCVLDDAVQGWLNAGLVEVIDGGEDQAGSGGAEPDVLGDES